MRPRRSRASCVRSAEPEVKPPPFAHGHHDRAIPPLQRDKPVRDFAFQRDREFRPGKAGAAAGAALAAAFAPLADLPLGQLPIAIGGLAFVGRVTLLPGRGRRRGIFRRSLLRSPTCSLFQRLGQRLGIGLSRTLRKPQGDRALPLFHLHLTRGKRVQKRLRRRACLSLRLAAVAGFGLVRAAVRRIGGHASRLDLGFRLGRTLRRMPLARPLIAARREFKVDHRARLGFLHDRGDHGRPEGLAHGTRHLRERGFIELGKAKDQNEERHQVGRNIREGRKPRRRADGGTFRAFFLVLVLQKRRDGPP